MIAIRTKTFDGVATEYRLDANYTLRDVQSQVDAAIETKTLLKLVLTGGKIQTFDLEGCEVVSIADMAVIEPH